jgi:hypothetical protein
MFDWLKRKTEKSESHQQSSLPGANFRAADLPPRHSEMQTTSKWWKAEDIAVKNNNRGEKGLAEIMRQMRLKMLNAAPSDFNQAQTQEFPHVWGLVMDWPLPAGIMTLVCFTTGDASIYTTTSFGVLGGIAHQKVRNAVENCIKVAQSYYEDATPTQEYPYPTNNQVNFYLVCYNEVRMIVADLKAVSQTEDKCSGLYAVAQKVITEIRLIAQPEMEKRVRS